MYRYAAIVAIVVIGGWYIFGMIEENGQLAQANSTLKQAVKDSEAVNNELKAAAKLTEIVVIKTEREKTTLQKIALNKTHELEILKYENKKIKAWAISLLPSIISRKLWIFAGSNNKDRILTGTIGTIETNTRTGIIQNETLYQYAINGITALRSCNADKAGFLDWHKKKTRKR